MPMQIPVNAAPGSSYGCYFHHLLLEHDLLLLGLYRQVDQDGLTFRATITNPHYRLTLQEGDQAFVVAGLHFPNSFNPTAEQLAAAWPPGTLGFGNLEPAPDGGPDLLVMPEKILPLDDSFTISSDLCSNRTTTLSNSQQQQQQHMAGSNSAQEPPDEGWTAAADGSCGSQVVSDDSAIYKTFPPPPPHQDVVVRLS
eukprot:gene6539-6765_t